MANYSPGKSTGRAVQIQNSGGSCGDTYGNTVWRFLHSVHNIPPGCSLQTGGDWTPHYRLDNAENQNCNSYDARYQLVCTDPTPTHPTQTDKLWAVLKSATVAAEKIQHMYTEYTTQYTKQEAVEPESTLYSQFARFLEGADQTKMEEQPSMLPWPSQTPQFATHTNRHRQNIQTQSQNNLNKPSWDRNSYVSKHDKPKPKQKQKQKQKHQNGMQKHDAGNRNYGSNKKTNGNKKTSGNKGKQKNKLS